MLQAEISQVRDPMKWLSFIKLSNPSSHIKPWGLQTWRSEKEIKLFLESMARAVREVENVTISDPTF
jgi:hypothetical protein